MSLWASYMINIITKMHLFLEIRVADFDPENAKKLLSEAGWADGFDLVITTPNNRNINEVKVAQFMASTLAQIGIRPTVDAMPLNMFVPKRKQFELSAYTLGAGPNLDLSVPLNILSGTRDADKGSGASNYSGYSDPEFDSMLAQAMKTVDSAEREQLYRTASNMAADAYACLPLYFEPGIWVLREGLTMTPRTDAKTFAMGVRSE